MVVHCGTHLIYLPPYPHMRSHSYVHPLSLRSLVVVLFLASTMTGTSAILKLFGRPIRAISFDVTGTLLVHKDPIMDTYAACAVHARLPNPPSAEELKPAFKQAYKETLLKSPCFRNDDEHYSSRGWWVSAVRRALELTGRHYDERDFNRFFRRVYQHYGSPAGYEVLDDTRPFLSFLKSRAGADAPHERLCLGITTNTPIRTVETVLPMMGLHDDFSFFVCCQDVGEEKPAAAIFHEAFLQAQFALPNLQRHEVLHVGDSLAADFHGARAYGFQAVFLDRSANAKVRVYQDWLVGPEYEGKSAEDVAKHTVTDFADLQKILS